MIKLNGINYINNKGPNISTLIRDDDETSFIHYNNIFKVSELPISNKYIIFEVKDNVRGHQFFITDNNLIPIIKASSDEDEIIYVNEDDFDDSYSSIDDSTDIRIFEGTCIVSNDYNTILAYLNASFDIQRIDGVTPVSVITTGDDGDILIISDISSFNVDAGELYINCKSGKKFLFN